MTQENLNPLSQQPRFNDPKPDVFYTSVYNFVRDLEAKEPPYVPDSRKRDEWLRIFIRKEPHLMGVINGAVSIDKNRGWSMVGGRNQVIAFTDTLHAWEAAPGLHGYRAGQASAAFSYYTSDMGAILECGREGKGGPLRAIFHVDPARCNLTNDPIIPLRYFPPREKMQYWEPLDFMRIASLPSTDEIYRGLGFCAVSRATQLAKIMIAVYQHDLEMLGAAAPRGLLLIKGIGEQQWNDAMAAREAAKDGDMDQYFSAVAVLASGANEIDAKLIALSQLPADFNHQVFTDLLMYGYALCFGYDPGEFWPVKSSSLNKGTEATVQHEKGSYKGGLDYALAFQESLQDNLPDTIQYEFDARDQGNDMVLAMAHKAWGDAITAIAPWINPEEGRELLAEHEVIPIDWLDRPFTPPQVQMAPGDQNPADNSPQEGDTQKGSDNPAQGKGSAAQKTLDIPAKDHAFKRMREMLKERTATWRAAKTFPTEPLVRYQWPDHKTWVVWERGEDVFAREIFPAAKLRATESEVLYHDNTVTIDQSDVDRAISEAERRVSSDLSNAIGSEPIH